MEKLIFVMIFAISLFGCSTQKPIKYKCTDLENKHPHNIVSDGNSLSYDSVLMKKYDSKKVKFESNDVKIDTVIDIFKNINGDDYVSLTKHEGKLIYVYALNVNSDKAVSMGVCN
ncbi:hypothetical protein ABWC92_004598 [Escherichia coli]